MTQAWMCGVGRTWRSPLRYNSEVIYSWILAVVVQEVHRSSLTWLLIWHLNRSGCAEGKSRSSPALEWDTFSEERTRTNSPKTGRRRWSATSPGWWRSGWTNTRTSSTATATTTCWTRRPSTSATSPTRSSWGRSWNARVSSGTWTTCIRTWWLL